MSSKKVVAAVVLAAALTWSTVMTVLGHAAAAAVLLPSLGLLIQQTVQALTPSQGPPCPPDPPGRAPCVPPGSVPGARARAIRPRVCGPATGRDGQEVPR